MATTMKRASQMTSRSRRSRSATSGNKNVMSRARRSSAMDQKRRVARTFTSTHTGPYLGRRSV